MTLVLNPHCRHEGGYFFIPHRGSTVDPTSVFHLSLAKLSAQMAQFLKVQNTVLTQDPTKTPVSTLIFEEMISKNTKNPDQP